MVNTLNPPPEVIASWPTPNYIDPQTRGSGLLALTISLMVLGFITVSARTYSRTLITQAFGADDVLILLGYIFSLALSSLIIDGNLNYYSGRHVWDIPLQLFVPHRKNIWWSELCYILASSTIKISVLLFYRRLSISFTRTFLWATWIGIILNSIFLLGFVLWLTFLCHPFNAYWNSINPQWRATHEYTCARENFSLPFSAGLSVLTDLYATVVPLILITTMKKTFKEKLALSLLFSFGFLIIIFAIVRTVYSYRVLNVTYDFTWTLYMCWIWAQLELYTALIVASAPALRPLFRHGVALITNNKENRPSYIPHRAHRQSSTFVAGKSRTMTASPETRKSTASYAKKSTSVSQVQENPFEMAMTIENASREASFETCDPVRPHSLISAVDVPHSITTHMDDKHVSNATVTPIAPVSPTSTHQTSRQIRLRYNDFDSSHTAMLASP